MKRRVAALFMAVVLCTSSLNVSAEETSTVTYTEQTDEAEEAETEATEESGSEKAEEAVEPEESAKESADASESMEESVESGEEGEDAVEAEDEELVIVQEETTEAEVEKFQEGTNENENISLTISENTTYYTSISNALTAVGSSEATVKLLADVTEDVSIAAGQKITIDLNGHTLTVTGNSVTVYGSLTVCDTSGGETGAISLQNAKGMILVEGENSKFTLNGGTLNSPNYYGVYCKDGGTAIVNGGEITSLYCPLSGNNTTGDMYFKVNGGTLTAAYGPAIYMPGPVSLTITGGTLYGGISLRMGIVNISGGTIYAATDNIDSPTEYYNYSGNAWLPDALYVFGGTYTSDNKTMGNTLSINITGGEFICKNGQGSAVAIYDLGKVAQSASVEISGSAVLTTDAEGRDAYQVLSLEDINVTDSSYGITSGKVETAISGGTFSTKVDSEYCVEGYVPIATTDADGNIVYKVAEGTYTASVTIDNKTKYYISLTDAIEAAGEDNATIVLLKDVAEDITIAKNQDITLDLGGYTITGVASHTIANYGTLTIIDSSEAKSGRVEATVTGKAALYNQGTVTVKGGYFTRTSGTWYTVVNDGWDWDDNGETKLDPVATLTFEDGVTVETSPTVDNNSSMIHNYGGTMIVNGGTFISDCLACIKNEPNSELTINGGNITNKAESASSKQGAIINAGTVSVTGGEITSYGYAIFATTSSYKGVTSITGGTFYNTGSSTRDVVHWQTNSEGKAVSMISGGTFNNYRVAADDIVSDCKMMYTGDDGSLTVVSDEPEESAYQAMKLNTNGVPIYFADADDAVSSNMATGNDGTIYLWAALDSTSGKTVSTTGYTFVLMNESVTVDASCFTNYTVGMEVLTESGTAIYDDETYNTVHIYQAVTENSAQAKVVIGEETTYYATVGAAVTAANKETTETVTVIALKDHTYSGIITPTRNMTIDLNGCRVEGSNSYGVIKVATSDITVTVIDSSAEGTGAMARSNATTKLCTVTAGTLILTGGSYTGTFKGVSTGTLIIIGGTYSSEPEAYLEDGYISVLNDDEIYEVFGPYEACVTDGDQTNYYETIEEALSAAADGVTVTLMKNVKISAALETDKSITVALNGYELDIDSGVSFTVKNGASVTIEGDTGIVANRGIIVVEDGTLDISTLGIAASADDSGLLSGTNGLISLGAKGVFAAPSAWLTKWSGWNPGTASTKDASGYIIESAVEGAQVKCQERVWTCKETFENGDGTDCWGEYEAVVTVGSESSYYGTFEAAFEAATDGAAITLLDEVTIDTSSDTLVWSSGSLTIDLNGHTISTETDSAESSPTDNGAQLFRLESGSLTLTGSGEIRDYVHRYVIRVTGSGDSGEEDYSTLTIDEDVRITAAGYPVQVHYGSNSYVAYGVVVNVAGTLTSDYTAALTVNGNVEGTDGYVPVVNITGTLVSNGKTVLNSDDLAGLYAAGYAVYNIGVGADISGVTGIEIRAGVLNVTGGTITGNGIPTETGGNANGSTTTGAGIAVVQHTTKLPVKVNITGAATDAVISGYTVLYEANTQGNDEEAIKKVEISVTGGYFRLINDGTNVIVSEDCTGFASGGHFTDLPDEVYLAESYVYTTSAATLGDVIYLYGVVDTSSGDAGLMYSTDEDGELTVTLNGTFTYTGSAIKPNPVLKDGSKALTLGTDYKLSYKNNTAVAKSTDAKAPTVIIKGIGNYSDLYQEITFTISARDIDEATATCADVRSTDSEAESRPTVKYNNKTLKLNTDYTVKYSMESDVDALGRVTAIATITGKGNFTGTKEVTYKVYYNKVNLKDLEPGDSEEDGSLLVVEVDDSELTYNGTTQKPDVVVKIRTSEADETPAYDTLILNKDYTVKYSNNKNAGDTASVTITGKGSFSGTAKKQTFSIAPVNLSDLDEGDVNFYVKNPSKAVTTVTSLSSTLKVTLSTGKTVTLKKGTDYTLASDESLTVYAEGNKNYTGYTDVVHYSIGAVNLNDSGIEVEVAGGMEWTYTGSAIKPKVVVTDGYGYTLVEGKDYTLSYKNNVNAGGTDAAQIIIKGKTNYTGSRIEHFTVKACELTDEAITVTTTDIKVGAKVNYRSLAVVKYGTKKLSYGKDYTIISDIENGTKVTSGNVEAMDNFTITIKAGTGGNYVDNDTENATATVHCYTYAISSSVKATVSPAYYTGDQLEPSFIVYNSKTGKVLTADEDGDYTYEYGDNTKVGTKSGSIILTGVGKYGGTAKTVRFAIRAKSIYDVLNSMFGLDL